MKVFEINSVAGIRSTGRICTDIAKMLFENGHECKIAYGREKAPDFCKDYTVNIGTKLGAYARFARGLVFDDQGKGAILGTKKLIKEMKAFSPDIIHLHNIHGYYLNIRMLFEYLAEADVPVVWTLHDCWAFTGHCAYFDFVECDKWRTGACESCPAKGEYPPSILRDRSKKNLKEKKELFTSVKKMTLVTPSAWLAELTRSSFLGKYEVATVNNGIDLDVFKPTEGDILTRLGLEGKRIILGVASVWERRKGLADFLEIAKKITPEWHVVLVGLNKKQIAALPENVTGIERTNSGRELAELYSAADVFVNPTYEDNFPTVNMEALACGTPVVTYNTGGSPESADEKYSKIVEKGDTGALLSAIYDTKKTDGINAERFDKNEKYLEYLALYERILANKTE
ncbi:MAG: glycosyltransferase [Clostridia bacterium]|nr:glycosyltransferase [Clostridia bacterium]